MRECSPHLVSHVTCHMSHVTCHLSHVTCQQKKVSLRIKLLSLLMEGLLSTGPSPSSLSLTRHYFGKMFWLVSTCGCLFCLLYFPSTFYWTSTDSVSAWFHSVEDSVRCQVHCTVIVLDLTGLFTELIVSSSQYFNVLYCNMVHSTDIH